MVEQLVTIGSIIIMLGFAILFIGGATSKEIFYILLAVSVVLIALTLFMGKA